MLWTLLENKLIWFSWYWMNEALQIAVRLNSIFVVLRHLQPIFFFPKWLVCSISKYIVTFERAASYWFLKPSTSWIRAASSFPFSANLATLWSSWVLSSVFVARLEFEIRNATYTTKNFTIAHSPLPKYHICLERYLLKSFYSFWKHLQVLFSISQTRWGQFVGEKLRKKLKSLLVVGVDRNRSFFDSLIRRLSGVRSYNFHSFAWAAWFDSGRLLCQHRI